MGSIPACAGEPCRRTERSSRWAVYPRVCGGTPTSRSRPAISRGLSPRVRGNPRPTTRPRAALRSIPACAGEPAPSYFFFLVFAVYPRVCGGTPSGSTPWDDASGLSPRVRGNRVTDVR